MADNGKKDKDKDDKVKDKEKTSKDDNENKEEGADQDKEKDEERDQPDEGKENEKDQDKDKAAEDKDKGEAAEDKDQTNEDKAEDETDKDKAIEDKNKAAEGEEKDRDNPDEDKDKENADEDKNKTDEEKMQDDEKEKAEKAQAEEDEAIDKKPKLLAGDPLQETKEETEAIKEGVQTFKEGDMLKIEDVFEDLKDEQRKQNADNLINDMLAEEANHPDNIGETKVSRKYNSGSLFAKIPFSWGNLDVYLHSRYDNINVVMRCFIECVIICVLFMFLPILLISLPPYTKSYNIFQNLSAMSKVNNYTEFFRENLFVSLCYCLFIIFSLLTDNMLVIMGYILQMFGIPIEGSVGEILQMLMSSKKHIRNSIVSILVFCLAVWLISDYEFFSHKISLCHLSMTLVFWYFLVSTIFFVESFCMNYLLSELRRKSFRGRIWDVNYKTFVFKKLAAIADASTPGSGSLNPRVRMVIRDLKNDYDTGFFLKHNDLNLTSVEQAKSIPNGIFAYLDLSDELPYDLLKKFFPSNHLEVYEYLSGNSVNKETTDFPPINYENFEAKCVDLFQERMDIARSLYDRDIILRKLDFVLFSVMFFFSAIIFLILLDVDYKVYVASIGPFFFGLGWIFQDSIKELYRCFVFLLLSHPFDCGDRVKIDNEELTVLRIDLLYSTFVTFTGKIKYIPNAAMFLKNVENYRRSDLQSEDVTITVSNNTTFVQLLRVRDKLAEFLKLNQNNFTGSIFVRNYEPDGPNMKVILSIEHTSNFQDLKPRFIRRDILLKELERVLDSESIAYNHVFVCSD